MIALAGKGDRLFSASRDKSIKVWDLTQKNVKAIETITGHDAAVTSLLIKGSYLLSADGKGIIKVIFLSILMLFFHCCFFFSFIHRFGILKLINVLILSMLIKCGFIAFFQLVITSSLVPKINRSKFGLD